MRSKFTFWGVIAFSVLVFVFYRCGKENAVSYHEDAKTLLNKVYPQKVEQEYNLVIRYESRNEPSTWNNFSWKKDNDYLEKKGLLKQIVSDTLINIWNHFHNGFEKKHQFVYKVQLSDNLKAMMSDPQNRYKSFNEYDRANQGTGIINSINCNITCGTLILENISKIQQKNTSYTSVISYSEKFIPTAFNQIVNYPNKLTDGQIISRNATAKRSSDKVCKLIF